MVFVSLYAFAQTDKASIEGHVLDVKTHEPIAYASILIKGTTRGTLSDKDGDFIFRELKEGNYTLIISFVGYEKREYSVRVTSQTVHAHIELKPTQVMLDDIVISASKTQQSHKEAPIIVNVLTNKNFEKTDAQDILQALSYQSGVRIEYNCQNCGAPQVRINGLEGSYTQLLIDSRPIMSSLTGMYGLEQLPLNMVDRVEVLKGGGSCLYGSNAIAGVVNVITKEPLYPSFSIGTDFQSIGGKSFAQYYNANCSVISKDQKAGASFYQTYRKRNPYDENGDGFSEIGKLDAFSFGTKTYYRFSNTQKVTFEYHALQESRRGGNDFDLPAHEADLCEKTDYRTQAASANYDYISLNAKQHYNIYASTQYIDRDSYFGSHQDPLAYGKTTDLTLVFGAQGTNQIDKFLFAPSTLVYGLEYNGDKLNDKYVSFDRKLEQNAYTFGGFVQNEWKVGKFNILVGTRLDKHNMIDKAILSPRLNVMYKPSSDLQLRLSYSTGYKAPQTYNEDLHAAQVGGETLIIKLAPGLKPEYSNSLSFSTDYYVQIGENYQANVLFEGFYTALNDVFAYREKDDSIKIEEKYNALGAKVYGASLTAKISYLARYTLTLGYTLQSSKYNKMELWSDEAEGTKNMLRTPNNYGFVMFSAQPTKALSLSASGTYNGKMYVPHLTTNTLKETQTFFDFNLAASYNFCIGSDLYLQLGAGVKNIFNSYQNDFDKGADRDSEYIYGPIQPRTLYISLKIFSN